MSETVGLKLTTLRNRGYRISKIDNTRGTVVLKRGKDEVTYKLDKATMLYHKQ
jgi:hypothetical protein